MHHGTQTEKIPLAMSSGLLQDANPSLPQRIEPQALYQLVPTHDSLAEGENANTQRQYLLYIRTSKIA